MRLIFCRSREPSSLLIRLVQGLRAGRLALAPWSHVAIVCADGVHVIDSFYWRGGVSAPRTLESFHAGFSDYLEVDVACDAAREAEAQAWTLTQVGQPYDWRGLLGFVAGWNTAGNGWYCFDFAAEALRRAAIDVSVDRTDCFKLLRAAGVAT